MFSCFFYSIKLCFLYHGQLILLASKVRSLTSQPIPARIARIHLVHLLSISCNLQYLYINILSPVYPASHLFIYLRLTYCTYAKVYNCTYYNFYFITSSLIYLCTKTVYWNGATLFCIFKYYKKAMHLSFSLTFALV